MNAARARWPRPGRPVCRCSAGTPWRRVARRGCNPRRPGWPRWPRPTCQRPAGPGIEPAVCPPRRPGAIPLTPPPCRTRSIGSGAPGGFMGPSKRRVRTLTPLTGRCRTCAPRAGPPPWAEAGRRGKTATETTLRQRCHPPRRRRARPRRHHRTHVDQSGSSGGRSAKGGDRSNGTGGRAPVDREQNQAIREWASKQGMTVSERGRIPREVTDAYHRAH
jgi:hypothetical protein